MRDIPKIRICHIVANNHPEVIFGMRNIIAVDHTSDGEEDACTGRADDDNNEVDVVAHGGGTEEANRDIGIVEIYIEEEEEVVYDDAVGNTKKGLLQSSLQYFCLMTNNLMVQDLRTNRKAQEDLFRHICNVRVRSKWESGARRAPYALHVAVTADNHSILNPHPLDTIIGNIMQDAKGKGNRKKLPQRRLNIIDGCINSYYVNLN